MFILLFFWLSGGWGKWLCVYLEQLFSRVIWYGDSVAMAFWVLNMCMAFCNTFLNGQVIFAILAFGIKFINA